MLSLLRRLLKWTVMALLALTILFASKDALHLNPAQQAAAPYTYDLVQWHAANFLSKWVHRLGRALPGRSLSQEEKHQRVQEYFQLGQELSQIRSQRSEAAAETDQDSRLEVMKLEAQAKELESRRDRLRNDVEETIEATISSVISQEGLGSLGGFILPPVDIRLTDPPTVLVTSPRDRIQRTHDVLLDSDITLQQRERLEVELLRTQDTSALVLNIGGVATYPASLPNSRPLQSTLRTSAHEWLHHYLFFRSLGQNFGDSDQMQTLNETVADIAGREIGNRAFRKLGGAPEPQRSDGERDEEGVGLKDENTFDFDREMRETRLRVDELLAQGRIAEAEAYMEERRTLFVDNGFYIRKLNQAYFAFHGTYADSAASISPIGDQLHQLRALTPDLGAFIRTMAGISSYRQFLDKLQQLGAEAKPP